jgi:hypothetical protein
MVLFIITFAAGPELMKRPEEMEDWENADLHHSGRTGAHIVLYDLSTSIYWNPRGR